MKIGEYEFPDECPKKCPMIGVPFDQGNTCCSCPIFCCREFEYNGTMVRMLRPEDFDLGYAEVYYNWLKEYME